MFSFNLQALTDSSAFMCALVFVCVYVACMASAEKIDVCMNMKNAVIGKNGRAAYIVIY